MIAMILSKSKRFVAFLNLKPKQFNSKTKRSFAKANDYLNRMIIWLLYDFNSIETAINDHRRQFERGKNSKSYEFYSST